MATPEERRSRPRQIPTTQLPLGAIIGAALGSVRGVQVTKKYGDPWPALGGGAGGCDGGALGDLIDQAPTGSVGPTRTGLTCRGSGAGGAIGGLAGGGGA